MKQLRAVIFVVLACAGLFAVVLPAQVVTQQWSSRDIPPEENSQSSSVYFLGNDFRKSSCFIWVRRDGTGVIIVAKDAHYIDPGSRRVWQLGETIRITKTDGGVEVKRSCGETRMVSDRFGGVRGYDIFGEHYRDAATTLPPQIQKLFYGEYGIGEKP